MALASRRTRGERILSRRHGLAAHTVIGDISRPIRHQWRGYPGIPDRVWRADDRPTPRGKRPKPRSLRGATATARHHRTQYPDGAAFLRPRRGRPTLR